MPSEEDSIAIEQRNKSIEEECVYNKKIRWLIVFLTAFAGILSPIGTNIYFPVLSSVAEDLNVTTKAINLSVSIFIVCQGLAPSVWGSMSDVLGRRPIYLSTFIVFIGACFGLANANSYTVLMILRCLQACGSASVTSIGSATIGDISTRAERGLYLGWFNVGPMLGPCIGPIAGGLLSSKWGWRSVFWFLGTWAIISWFSMLLFLPETLRSIVGNGTIPATGINKSLLSMYTESKIQKEKSRYDALAESQETLQMPPKQKSFKDIDWLASFKIMLETDVLITLTYNGISYACSMMVLTSMPQYFESTYNLTEIELGLCYLAGGVGSLASSLCNGLRLNYDYRIIKERHDASLKEGSNDTRFPIEQARLRSLPIVVITEVCALLGYGWTTNQKVHISAPLIFQFVVGFTSTMMYNTLACLLVDLFPGASASASAARNLSRCVFGAIGTAIISPLIQKVGMGFAFTIIACINLLLSPLLWLEWVFGPKFQVKREQKLEEQQKLELVQ